MLRTTKKFHYGQEVQHVEGAEVPEKSQPQWKRAGSPGAGRRQLEAPADIVLLRGPEKQTHSMPTFLSFLSERKLSIPERATRANVRN